MRSLALVSLVLVACSEPAPPPAPSERAASEEPARPEPAVAPEGLIAPGALAAVLPDAIGEHTATGAAEHGVEREGAIVTTWASRAYRRGEATATLRVIDASRAPDLIVGFAAAQVIDLPAGADGFELVPTGVGDRPALASWDPATSTSEAQVLVHSRVIVAIAIGGARAPEEAIDLLDGAPLDALEALVR